MPAWNGTYLPLSPPRRWVGDLVEFGRRVPLVPFERRMHLSEVAAARTASVDRPGWCALFLKAYALVAARTPALRRAYLGFPWARLYEHPFSVAAVAIDRPFGDDPNAVFFTMVRRPEAAPLVEIDAHLRRRKTEPAETAGEYRRHLRLASLPGLVRRWVWWWALNGPGPRRARVCGTFGVSVTAGLGASALALVSPLTTNLHYAPLDEDGTMDVRITFDHRVLDGVTICRALADLEDVLCNEIVAELAEPAAARRAG